MRGFLLRLWKRRRQPVVVPDGHVLPPDQALAGWDRLVRSGRDGLLWLGHVAFLLRLGGVTLLTDPWLGDWAGPRPGLGPKRYVPPGIPVQRLPPVDAVLLSHNHYDHLCSPTLHALAGRPGLRTLVPLGLKPLLARLGHRRVTELDWGQAVTIQGRDGGATVTALPAIHQSARTAFDCNRSLWCSYAIQAGERRIWFGGDTAHGPVFAGMGAAHGPFDLALVGIGAYQPRSLMKPVHADPEEAVRIARDLRARRVLGMHWGTVVLTEEDPFEPPVRFRAAAAAAGYGEDEAWILRVGEARALPAGTAG